MPAPTPRVFTIAPSQPFLRTLVDALFDGTLVPGWRWDPADPLALADVTLLVPTRRAARALREAILAQLGDTTAILPAIRPLGDVDEDEQALDAVTAALEGEALDLPPAIGAVERRLILTQLVARWRTAMQAALAPAPGREPVAVPASPADAAAMAGDLIALMDQAATEEIDWAGLKALVADQYAAYWQLTLTFLDIITNAWPAILRERGALDPAARRRLLIDREAARLARVPPRGPIVAAGSTASIPATARLLATIAGLPMGAVVLPGLDRDLDAEAWAAIGGPADPQSAAPSHPQYGLRQWLDRLGLDRADVMPLGQPPVHGARRDRLVGEALRPSEATGAWRDLFERTVAADPAGVAAAFADVTLLPARTEQEEALAIALVLRETLETPGRTAALVTPDRALARRVAAELERWSIRVDDSAGLPLTATPPGLFARLVIAAASATADPVTLLSLLKHPLCALGRPAEDTHRAAEALELAALRGPRPRPGLAGLIGALGVRRRERDSKAVRVPLARERLSPAQWDAAGDLLARLVEALQPLLTCVEAGEASLATWIDAHTAALRAVARGPDSRDDELLADEAGEALARFLGDHAAAARAEASDFILTHHDYASMVDVLLAGNPVRRVTGQHPRIAILGPLEARLQAVDCVILGGLIEGVWPATTRSDPWLSRPMRAGLALEPPERRIGLAAHDFAQALGAPRVVLSYAERVGGAPTVPSRWVQRLTALLGPDQTKPLVERSRPIHDWARTLDRPADPTPHPASRPMPTPALAHRPSRLSVTEIERWIRDPYAIYARHVLRLEPIEPIASPPDHRERGTLVHDILAEFLGRWSGPFDATADRALIEEARRQFIRLADYPEVAALWWPRMERIARFVVATEATTPEVARRLVEIDGSLDLHGTAMPFRLTGRADRIDLLADGRVRVIDYKTGQPPSVRQVQSGLAPQLPLEAAMIRSGGFADIPADRALEALLYWHLPGSATGNAVKTVAGPGAPKDTADPETLAADALDRLRALVDAFANPATPYTSRPRLQFRGDRGGDYDHLARVDEWAGSDSDEGEGP